MSMVPANSLDASPLEAFLEKHLRWPNHEIALVDSDKFVERVQQPFEALLSAEAWVNDFYETHTAALEFMSESDPESAYVYEFDLSSVSYVVLEEKSEVVIVSSKGMVSVPRTEALWHVLQTPPAPAAQAAGQAPQVVLVTQSGDQRSVDLNALLEVIKDLRTKSVELPKLTSPDRRLAQFAPTKHALTPERAAQGLVSAGLARPDEIHAKFEFPGEPRTELSANKPKPHEPGLRPPDGPQIVVRPRELYKNVEDAPGRGTSAGNALRFWGDLLERMGRQVATTATGYFVFGETMAAEAGKGEELFSVQRGGGTVIVRRPVLAPAGQDHLMRAMTERDAGPEESNAWLGWLNDKLSAGSVMHPAMPGRAPAQIDANWATAANDTPPLSRDNFWVTPEHALATPGDADARESDRVESRMWLDWMRNKEASMAPIYTAMPLRFPGEPRAEVTSPGNAGPGFITSPGHALKKLNLRDYRNLRENESPAAELEAEGRLVAVRPPKEPIGARPVMPINALRALMTGIEQTAKHNPQAPAPAPMVPDREEGRLPVAAWLTQGRPMMARPSARMEEVQAVSRDLSRVLTVLPFPDDSRVEVGGELTQALDSVLGARTVRPMAEGERLVLRSVADAAFIAREHGGFGPEKIRLALEGTRTPVAAWMLGPAAPPPGSNAGPGFVSSSSPLSSGAPQGSLVEGRSPFSESESSKVVRLFMRLPGALPSFAPKPALQPALLGQAVDTSGGNSVVFSPRVQLNVTRFEKPDRTPPAALDRADKPGGPTEESFGKLAFPRLDPAAIADLLSMAYGLRGGPSAAAAPQPSTGLIQPTDDIAPLDLSSLVNALGSVASALRFHANAPSLSAPAGRPAVVDPVQVDETAVPLARALASTMSRPAALNFGLGLSSAMRGLDFSSIIAARSLNMPRRDDALGGMAPLASAELSQPSEDGGFVDSAPAGEMVDTTHGFIAPRVTRGAYVRRTLDDLLRYLGEASRTAGPTAPGAPAAAHSRETPWPLVMMLVYAGQAEQARAAQPVSRRPNIGGRKWELRGAHGATMAAGPSDKQSELIVRDGSPRGEQVTEARSGMIVQANASPSASSEGFIPSPENGVARALGGPENAFVTSPKSVPGMGAPSGSSINMTVVRAVQPTPPTLGGDALRLVTPRLKKKSEAGGEPARGGAVGLQATVDAIAQRIFHRIKRRIESDTERSGGT